MLGRNRQYGTGEKKGGRNTAERHPFTTHDKIVNRWGRTPRRVTGSGFHLPGREDRSFQHVCVLPGYDATSGVGVKLCSKNRIR
ncbi:hypothetical protein HDC89_002193 [Herbaspirillum sp. SJZ102]|nr:hypothetical protein [Herbaspirillum sp. SJZ102]